MKKLIKIEASHPKLLKIYYDLGNVCNYKCWYCFPDSNNGTTGWPDIEIAKKNIVGLINYYHSTKLVNDIELHLLGGEPTLWKHLGEFVEYVSNNSKVRICILTNGSRTLRWWNEYAHYFDQIGISVHHESCDVNHIVELGNLLYKKDLYFHTSVLMDHMAWDKCEKIVNTLQNTNNKWIVLAKAIHIDGIQKYQTKKEKQFLFNQVKRWPPMKHWIKHLLRPIRKFKAYFSDGSVVKTNTDTYFLMNELNHFKGWECTVGINYLYIGRTGEISGTCKEYLYGIDYYYNLNDPDFIDKFKPVIKPVICSKNICLCSGEAALTKKCLDP